MNTQNRTNRLSCIVAVLLTIQIGWLALDANAGEPTVASSTVRVAEAPGPDAQPTHGVGRPFAPVTTTTTAPPPTTTTTTVAPAPPTTVAPPPPAPAPAPAPAPNLSPLEQAQAAYVSAVPAGWRNAIPVTIEIIGGSTSWGFPNGLLQVSTAHATSGVAELETTIAHEFGHMIAFHYGSQAFNGAAPTGWPAYSSHPEEAWADCVAVAFTGIVDASHGLPPCSGASLSWTRQWLAAGPGGHARTD